MKFQVYKRPYLSLKQVKKNKQNNKMKLSILIASALGQKYNANNNYNNDNEYGYIYGDPHFMVKTPGQDQLCFDYSPKTSDPITLINDPVNAISITAVISDASGRMTEVDVSRFNKLKFDSSKI